MFQLFSWRLCLCLRLWNCFCICTWVPLPFLNSQDDFDSDCGLMGPLMINMTFIYVRNETNVRNERWEMRDVMYVTHGRTDSEWKVEKYSVWAQSTTITLIENTDPVVRVKGLKTTVDQIFIKNLCAFLKESSIHVLLWYCLNPKLPRKQDLTCETFAYVLSVILRSIVYSKLHISKSVRF